MVLESIDFQECVADSPSFREHIMKFEAQSELLRKRMKGMHKGFKSLHEAQKSSLDVSVSLASRFKDFGVYESMEPDSIIGPDDCGEHLEKFAGTLSELNDMQEILNLHVKECLVDALFEKRKDDFLELQKTKKNFDDSTKDFDYTFVKYQEKLKNRRHSHDPDADTALQKEVKRHELASVNYTQTLNRFQKRLRFEFMERILQYMYALQTFFHQGHEYMEELAPYLQMLNVELASARENYDKEMDTVGAQFGMYAEQRAEGEYGTERAGCNISRGIWRGYLNVLREGNDPVVEKSMLKRSRWIRQWCVLDRDGSFLLAGNRDGKLKEAKGSEAPADVRQNVTVILLDENLSDVHGRPFGFSIHFHSSGKVIILTADSFKEQNAWTSALAVAANAGCLNQSPSTSMSAKSNSATKNVISGTSPLSPRTALKISKLTKGVTDDVPENRQSLQLQGKLTVEVIEATGLATKDVAECDPYCILLMRKSQARTRRVRKTQNPRWRQQFFFDVVDKEEEECIITIYNSQKFSIKDDCLGRVVIPLRSLTDEKVSKNKYPLFSRFGPDKIGDPVEGHILLALFYHPVSEKLIMSDFTVISMIGKGSFGKVLQVRKNDTGRLYAMKIVKKSMIENDKSLPESLQRERDIMIMIDHPFLMSLQFSFQSNNKVYFVLDYINGGELYYHLKQAQMFSEDRARFYGAEVMSALDYLHGLGIIYRDLKAENVLLDYDGHVCLIDFGLCKTNLTTSMKTKTFCGTPDYVAPEVLTKIGYGMSVDWWSLGVLVWEMLFGQPPFESHSVQDTFSSILRKPIESLLNKCTARTPISEDARSFLVETVRRDPLMRLGARRGGIEFREHPFFAPIVWADLLSKKTPPPFKPRVKNEMDTSNFDAKFTKQAAIDTLYVDDTIELTPQIQRMFKGFSYMGESSKGGTFMESGESEESVA